MYATGYYATGYYSSGYYTGQQAAGAFGGLTWYSLLYEARAVLQDSDETLYRYPDTMLLNALNRGLNDLERIRPEAYWERGGVPEITTDNWTAVVALDLDMRFYEPLMWYVVGQMDVSEDEWVRQGRAAASLEKFRSMCLRV